MSQNLKEEIKIFIPTVQDSSIVTNDQELIDKFIYHNKDLNHVCFCSSAKQADIIIIFENWSFKQPKYTKTLLSDTFFTQFCEKIYVINYDDTVGEPFLPGCYTSLKLSNHDPSRFISSVYPKTYNDHFIDHHTKRQAPKYLFWFRGTPESHPIRKEIFDKLDNTSVGLLVNVRKEFHSHSVDEKKVYIDEMSDCLFVLCPRGHSPNTYRLYEAMSLGKCPVIISDEWVETHGPDWSNCSIRIAEKDISQIEELLLNRKGGALKLGENAKKEWLKHFTPETKYKAYLSQIIHLSTQIKAPTKTLTGYKSYWRSPQFLKRNNWSLIQKVSRKLKKYLYKP